MAQSIPFSRIEKNRYDENEHFFRPISTNLVGNTRKLVKKFVFSHMGQSIPFF